MKALLIVIPILIVMGAIMVLSAEPGMTDEEVAAKVAIEWTSSSIDDVSELAIGLLVGNVPIVTQLASSRLADQIRDRVTWSYSTPTCPRDGRCMVTATARMDLDINIPLILDETATIRLPFALSIDTGDERVSNWDVQLGSASVSGIELGSGAGNAAQALGSASDALRGIVDNEDMQKAFERLQELSSDEDVRQSFGDAAEALRDFSSDEDVQRSLEDASEAINEGLKGLFGQ